MQLGGGELLSMQGSALSSTQTETPELRTHERNLKGTRAGWHRPVMQGVAEAGGFEAPAQLQQLSDLEVPC